MSDLDGRYRIAMERIEGLRAEASRERLAREARAGRAGRRERPSVRVTLGRVLIRVGRALGGQARSTESATAALTPARGLEEVGS